MSLNPQATRLKTLHFRNGLMNAHRATPGRRPRTTRSSPIGYALEPTSRHCHVAELSLTVLSFID